MGTVVPPGERVCVGQKGLVIDLGCGKWKLEGAIGFDIDPASEADYICDLNEGIPLEDGSVSLVNMNHAWEHLRHPVRVMLELHRVLEPGGLWRNRMPYLWNPMAFYPPHVQFTGHEKWWRQNPLVQKLFAVEAVTYDPDPQVWPVLKRRFPDLPIEEAALLFVGAIDSITIEMRKR